MEKKLDMDHVQDLNSMEKKSDAHLVSDLNPSAGTTASGAGSVAAAVEALKNIRNKSMIGMSVVPVMDAIDALLALDVPGRIAEAERKERMHWAAYCGADAQLEASRERERITQDHRQREYARAEVAEADAAKLREQLAEAQKDAHYAEVAALREQLAAARKDIIVAAGEYRVEVPPPGTPMAALLSANVMMRRENEELRKALRVERETCDAIAIVIDESSEDNVCGVCGGNGQHQGDAYIARLWKKKHNTRRAAEKTNTRSEPHAAGDTAPVNEKDETAHADPQTAAPGSSTTPAPVTDEDRREAAIAVWGRHNASMRGQAVEDVARLIANVRGERDGAVRELVEALNAHAHGILSIDTPRALIKKHGGAA